MNRKAISLLSGGLDSILATRLMLEQGIEMEAVNFLTTFCTCTRKGCRSAARVAAETLKIPLKIFNIQEEYLEIVKNPKHGYGSHMNPCIDCRIFIFKRAKEHMLSTGASFIVTGEVLGERPMSQRRDAIMLIEKEAGLKGLVVRPLSAKHFGPTIPEQEGVVDRGRLLDIRGRSRKPQISLAAQFGIRDYPCPAGGCLLTDPGFAHRMRDLLRHDALTVENVKLLKLGRHFRFSEKVRLVIGRDEKENTLLEAFCRPEDLVVRVKDVPSPLAILRGEGAAQFLNDACSIVASHTKAKARPSCDVSFLAFPSDVENVITVRPADPEMVERLRIGDHTCHAVARSAPS
jgi:tRNA U34 2-thiouridine synthase MnmA/TrmU